MTTDGHQQPARHWRTVAELLAKENDPTKIAELAAELDQALERQDLINGKSKIPMPRPNP